MFSDGGEWNESLAGKSFKFALVLAAHAAALAWLLHAQLRNSAEPELIRMDVRMIEPPPPPPKVAPKPPPQAPRPVVRHPEPPPPPVMTAAPSAEPAPSTFTVPPQPEP